MDIQVLKCLLTVLHTGSFTKAGGIEHLSQSAISKKIISLENELGIKLIERSGKGVVLTPAGKRLIPSFINILESYNHTLTMLEKIKQEIPKGKKTLRLAGVPTIYRYNVIPLVEMFSKAYPDIMVFVEEMETDQLFLTLQYGDCDLAFCSDIKMDREYYETQFVYREKFMVALSLKHPLATRKSVSMRDLKNEKLIFNRRESLHYYPCVEACLNAGFTPTDNITTARPAIAYAYLHASNEYIYMGLQKTLLEEKTDLHINIPIEDSPEFNYVYAWKKNTLSENASLFLKFATAKQ